MTGSAWSLLKLYMALHICKSVTEIINVAVVKYHFAILKLCTYLIVHLY